jgi:hypothetical protein
MDTDEQPKPSAWQPLTFGGVAAFARAPFFRLFMVELIFALVAAASLVWFFHSAWEPALREAITRLPESGAIRAGRLEWNEPSPVRLASGSFLSIVVDVTDSGAVGFTADLQLELNETQFRLRSLLGYVTLKYPKGWIIALNRPELEPWWGAWRPSVLVGAGVMVVIGLLVAWGVLAAVYALLVRVIAFYTDREISRAGAWRLAVAALMPGSLFMSAAILAYGFNQLGLIRFLFAALLHVVVGWLYVLVAPLRLPRRGHDPARPDPKNPFQPPASESESEP